MARPTRPPAPVMMIAVIPSVARNRCGWVARYARDDTSAHLLHVALVVEPDPRHDRQRQRAVGQQVIVELAEAKRGAFRVAVAAEEAHDLPLARHVPDLLRRVGRRAGRLPLGGL